jgi:hypothetical protein
MISDVEAYTWAYMTLQGNDPSILHKTSRLPQIAAAWDRLAFASHDQKARRLVQDALRFTRPSLAAASPPTPLTLVHDARWREDGRWAATNPSVVAWGDFTLINYRLVNYRNRRASYYKLERDGVIRSRNIWQLRKTSDQSVVAEYELKVRHPMLLTSIQGLEDLRLFIWNGRICFTGSCAQLRHGQVRLVWGITNADPTVWSSLPPPDTSVVYVDALHELLVPNVPSSQCEKNWMPWATDADDGPVQMRWIYMLDPYRRVVAPSDVGMLDDAPVQVEDDTTGSVFAAPDTTDLSELRGSVGPVWLPQPTLGWVSLVHFYSIGDGRWYHHRWVVHDALSGRPVQLSGAFCFDADPAQAEVEFAAGLVVLPDMSGVRVTYGKNDREAWERIVTATELEALTWYNV